jgi:hypothetical protein
MMAFVSFKSHLSKKSAACGLGLTRVAYGSKDISHGANLQ